MGWLERAACRGLPPSMFYPEWGEEGAEARRICAGCPVRVECLDHAVVTGEKWGIWGGLNNKRRRVLRVRYQQEQQERGAA